MRCYIIAAAFLLGGCGLSSPVEYNELKGESSVGKVIYLGKILGHDGGDMGNHLWISLSGKGKHPSHWDASLSLELARVPKQSAPLLGERAKVKIRGWRPVETLVHLEDSYDPNFRTERTWALSSDEISIDDFVALAEGTSLEVNGQAIPLTPEQRNQIRDVVVAARRASAQQTTARMFAACMLAHLAT